MSNAVLVVEPAVPFCFDCGQYVTPEHPTPPTFSTHRWLYRITFRPEVEGITSVEEARGIIAAIDDVMLGRAVLHPKEES